MICCHFIPPSLRQNDAQNPCFLKIRFPEKIFNALLSQDLRRFSQFFYFSKYGTACDAVKMSIAVALEDIPLMTKTKRTRTKQQRSEYAEVRGLRVRIFWFSRVGGRYVFGGQFCGRHMLPDNLPENGFYKAEFMSQGGRLTDPKTWTRISDEEWQRLAEKYDLR
jgi:hypothetical protein